MSRPHALPYKARRTAPLLPAGGQRAPVEMAARYHGTCAATGAVIRPGDIVLYDRATRTVVLVKARTVSDEFVIGGRAYYRNRNGRCEDAPCCGCCTI